MHSLLTRLLAEQEELTAVERFAQRHADVHAPLLEPIYRARLPASPPGPGQQYGFEVDLDACSGCKACVTACHRQNGLDPGETWRAVGVLHGGDAAAPVLKTVTAACHHCVDPACLRGCPARAYEKDPVTGIVRHLDDACIGCRYCTLTCPYEVPQYNPARGIVRKCDLCAGRLAASEAPACVQACPSNAIAIRVVDVARAIEDAQIGGLVPGAPPSGHTVPTTIYRTREALPANTLPADFYAVRPAEPHGPLIVMLVLTQLSAGTLAIERVVPAATPRAWTALLALAVGLVALGASTLHLGRPLLAPRALLGLGTSWVSREILAFGAFAAAATTYAAAAVSLLPCGWAGALGDLAAGLGVAGVICSVMLYAVTRRAFWSAPRTALLFGGTSAVLGLAVVHAVAPSPITGAALAIAVAVKLAVELSTLAHLGDRRHGELKRSARLLAGELRGWLTARVALAIGGVALAQVVAPLGLLLLVAGELIERRSFFAAASAPRMPGQLA